MPSTPEPPAVPEMPATFQGPRLGIPISDDSSEDEQEILLGLNEEAGIFHNPEVVATPRNESDDDEPLRRFQLSHPGVHQKQQLRLSPKESARSNLSDDNVEDVLRSASPDDDFEHVDNIPMPKPTMERRMSVRFAEGYDESEKEKVRYPSPDTELYIKALENPMSVASDREDEFADLRDDDFGHPLGSPPAYTSGDEGAKTPPPVSGGSSQSLGRHLNEIKLDFTDRASQFENDSSPSDDDEEDDDDDKLGEIFERMRPELIGVELEDSQDVLDSMFDRTGEKLLDDEDFLKKLENPCLFSTNSSRSPSLKSYRSRSTEPLRSPRARSSSPEVRRSTSPNIVFSPSPRPQLTPYPRLISPESAISISPGSSRSSEPVLPVPRVSFSYDYGFGKDYTEDEIAVLTYIDQYKPVEEVIEPELHPFVIEYMAAFGDVDSFIKVPRPDEIDDNVGLTSLDEPPSDQSDAAIVDMQIRHATKDAAYLDDEVPVKILEKADEKPDEIKKWIADIKTLHKSQPATTVHYKTKLPDIETLMQEWTPKMEEIMRTIRLPTADLDVSLEKYVDICLNILDIPVGNSRIEALHVMFSLLNEFCNSQHFRNLAQNNSRVDDSRERMDRLEL